jgi:hypothetical protein
VRPPRRSKSLPGEVPANGARQPKCAHRADQSSFGAKSQPSALANRSAPTAPIKVPSGRSLRHRRSPTEVRSPRRLVPPLDRVSTHPALDDLSAHLAPVGAPPPPESPPRARSNSSPPGDRLPLPQHRVASTGPENSRAFIGGGRTRALSTPNSVHASLQRQQNPPEFRRSACTVRPHTLLTRTAVREYFPFTATRSCSYLTVTQQ